MPKAQHYVINTPEVVSEVIDGELVAIHLGSGCYYHANNSGSYIWDLLAKQYAPEQIIMIYAAYFKLSVAEAKITITAFVRKLLKEDLIRTVADPKTQGQIQKISPTPQPYLAPILEKHEDMKELLLLDPIHDIGEKSLPLVAVE